MADAPAKTAAEVGVRLVVDSNAKAIAEEVAKHLKGVGDEAGKTKKKIDAGLGANLKSIWSLAAMGLGATAAAALAAGAAVAGFGVHSAHAYMESAAEIKSLANTFTLLDDGSTSLQNIKRFAAQTKDELEDLSISSGTAAGSLVGAFNDVMERGGKTEEQAHRLVGAMAMAGRATEGGIEGLSSAFEAIQMGVIRAKNPIVGMIAATHTLKGNAKQVAKEMMAMPIEKQIALAETAIQKMADKMKDAPMTLAQMKTSMATAWDNIFERTGEHIVKAMSPALGKVREKFLEIQPDLADAGEAFGRYIGKGFDVAIPIIDELFNAFKANSGEIKKAFDEIVAPLKTVFEYVYENRGAFAKTIADVATLLINVAATLVKAITEVYGMIGRALKWVGKTGVLGSGVVQTIGEEELSGQSKGIRAAVQADTRTGDNGASSLEARTAARDKFVQTYTETYGADKAADAIARFDATWKRAVDDHTATMNAVGAEARFARAGDADSFVKAWNVASKAQDQGAMNYVAQFLMNNKTLQKALAEDGPKMMGAGFDALVQNLKAQGTLGADIAKSITTMEAPKGIASKANVVQNFNGPINVKQDFRDQDPDRVAIVFKEELGRIGSNRLQSRFVSPFGF